MLVLDVERQVCTPSNEGFRVLHWHEEVQFIRVLQLNPGWDTQTFMTAQPGLLPDPLWELVDPAVMKEPDREYAEHVFHLLCAVLAYAVVGTLQDPKGWKRQCEILKTRVAMIKYGCAAQGNGMDKKEMNP